MIIPNYEIKVIENIEFQWLVSFQHVYQQGSFKKAAEALELPSSNVSRHVALLERQLNVRLLERTTRKISATAAGKQLYQGIIPLTVAMNDTLDEVSKQGNSLEGHLKMIMPDIPFLADLVAEFCQLHPKIKLSCDTQLNPSDGMLEGFDLVLRFSRGPLEDSGWVAKELVRWPSCIVVAPKVLAHAPLPTSLEELKRSTCITSLSVLQGLPWRFKSEQTLQVKSSYRVNSGHMAKAAALKGLGFAILPKHACEDEINQGSLIEVKLAEHPEDLVLHALYSGRKYPLARVKACLTHIENGLKKLKLR